MGITKESDKTNKSVQEMQNLGFDTTFNSPTVGGLEYDGVSLQRKIASSTAIKVLKDGTDTYVGIAAPGTALGTAKWQAMKIDTDGNVSWADGDPSFDNVATDLSALSYS